MSEENNYPEHEIKGRGGISCAIWRTEGTKNGKTFDRFSIKLQKRYKDPATGEWKGSELFLFPSEVHAFVTIAQEAFEHCFLIENGDETIPV